MGRERERQTQTQRERERERDSGNEQMAAAKNKKQTNKKQTKNKKTAAPPRPVNNQFPRLDPDRP